MNLINTLPRNFLIALILIGGVVFIVLQDPPQTICDVQKKVFIENHQDFLFKNPENKIRTKTVFTENVEDCRKSNSPGGCYSLFYNIPRILQSFRAIEEKCHTRIAQISELKQALSISYSLFLEISWGEGPANELSNPLAWLSSNDISNFCHLQSNMLRLYGEPFVQQLRTETFKEIAPGHPVEKHRRFSILSEDCFKYP